MPYWGVAGVIDESELIEPFFIFLVCIFLVCIFLPDFIEPDDDIEESVVPIEPEGLLAGAEPEAGAEASCANAGATSARLRAEAARIWLIFIVVVLPMLIGIPADTPYLPTYRLPACGTGLT